jgi:hypothetical protein
MNRINENTSIKDNVICTDHSNVRI